jgi:hemerythrin-like domain-containing protein
VDQSRQINAGHTEYMSPEPSLPSFDEPLEQLVACHQRIEAQLCTLEGLVDYLAAKGCDSNASSTADSVLRYFDTSGALHHKDEDEDLFPLLRARAARQGRAEIAAAIEELEREHETMDAQWKRMRQRLLAVKDNARLDAEEVTRFAWLYRRHMDRESAAVLPFARETLDDTERAALGKRMAARRDVLPRR